jgi:hypothetical protein
LKPNTIFNNFVIEILFFLKLVEILIKKSKEVQQLLILLLRISSITIPDLIYNSNSKTLPGVSENSANRVNKISEEINQENII